MRAPDQAWISVATDTRDVKADAARQQSAAAMTAVQAALRAAGVPADAIRTTGYSLTPEFDWNNGRGTMKGYVAHNQVEVRVDDLDRLGAVIDAASAAKSTSLTVSSPRFELKNRQAAEAEALRLAVQAATGRAEAMAAGAKRTLGAIVRIEEHGDGVPVMPQFQRAGAVASLAQTPITPGEIEIRAQVTLTAELR